MIVWGAAVPQRLTQSVMKKFILIRNRINVIQSIGSNNKKAVKKVNTPGHIQSHFFQSLFAKSLNCYIHSEKGRSFFVLPL